MMQLWSKELLGSVAALKIYGLTLTYRASNGGGSSSTQVFYSASPLKPNITQDVYTSYEQITNITGNIGSAGSTITTADGVFGNYYFKSATTDLWGRPAFLYVTDAGWFNSAIIVSPKQKIGDQVFGYKMYSQNKWTVTLNAAGTGGTILMYYADGGTYSYTILAVGPAITVKDYYR